VGIHELGESVSQPSNILTGRGWEDAEAPAKDTEVKDVK
jgi:hypothetical protein